MVDNVKESNDHHALWDYVCEVYSKPDVEAACLQLQDDFGINIPLLLFCCWLSQQYCIDKQEIADALLTLCKSWTDNCIRPLRETRQRMKTAASLSALSQWQDMREDIKSLELMAERQLLEMLEEHAVDKQQYIIHNDSTTDEQAVIDRLSHNMKRLSLQPTVASTDLFAVILTAAYPKIAYHTLTDYLKMGE